MKNDWTRERIDYGLFKAIQNVTGEVKYSVRLRVNSDEIFFRTFDTLDEARLCRDQKMLERGYVGNAKGKTVLKRKPTPKRDRIAQAIEDWRPTHTPKRDRLRASIEEWRRTQQGNDQTI